MVKARLVFAWLFLILTLPLPAFDWETATANGREYVTLRSFCTFYGFGYEIPSGNDYFTSRNASHSIRLKVGTSDLYLDGVHYVMSFPVESGDHDWLVSRMDVIKLFEPVLRPTEISGLHAIRGVVIDAGHGGTDNGAVSARGGMEKNYTIDTAFRLESILRSAGLKTVLTRRTDNFVDLYERAHIAALYPDYCFVSIHYNSAEAEARGLETYCLSPRGAASTSSNYLTRSDIQKLPGNDYDAFNILLASMVHSEIIRLNPGDSSMDRGVKRARFVVIKQNVLPAILVEGGFVSNRMEAARVNTPAYRQQLAEAIARGIIRFVNIMGDKRMALPESSPEETPAPVRALPVTPPAPSGLANDPVTGRVHTGNGASSLNPSAGPGAGVTQTSPVSHAHKTRKKKSKSTVATAPAPATGSTTAPAVAPTPEIQASTPSSVPPGPGSIASPPAPENKSSPASGAGSLGLSEPKTPTPTPGSDKAAPEPDEPPTVNIYPSTGVSSKSGSSSSGDGSSSASTNAPSSGGATSGTP